MEDLLDIRRNLERHFSGIFRSIWVQTSSVKAQRTILLTLFFSSSNEYAFITLRNLREVTVEEILSRLDNNSIVNKELDLL